MISYYINYVKNYKIFFIRIRQVVTLLNVGHKILMSLTQILKEKGVMMGNCRNNDVQGESGRRRCDCECFERCLIEFLEDLLDALKEDHCKCRK